MTTNTKFALAMLVPAVGIFVGAMALRGPQAWFKGARSRARRRKGPRARRRREVTRAMRQIERLPRPDESEAAWLQRTGGTLGAVKVHGQKGKPGFSVSIDNEELDCFRRRWPDGSLDGLKRLTASFDQGGDLVDLECNKRGGACEKWDGSALVALTDDMQCAGESRLGIKDRCHSNEWLHCMRD